MARLGLIFLTLLSHSRTHVAPSHNRTVDFDYFSTPYQIDSNAFQASSYREIATTHFALRISTCGDFFSMHRIKHISMRKSESGKFFLFEVWGSLSLYVCTIANFHAVRSAQAKGDLQNNLKGTHIYCSKCIFPVMGPESPVQGQIADIYIYMYSSVVFTKHKQDTVCGKSVP